MARGIQVELILILMLASTALVAASVAADPAPLPAPRHIFVSVANDDGVKWDWDGARYGEGNNNTYYIKADGGGLNELHITNDTTVASGQVTTTAATSGTFYVMNTGGRGFDNDIVLLVSVKGPIPDDLALHVRSSGYNWTPAASGAYNPLPPTDYYRVDGAVDETFTKEDFIYGPQTWKPSPGDLVVPSQSLYYGQDINDPSTEEYLMFVDLDAGNMYPSKFPGATLVDNGAVKVEYAFTNLTTRAEFNGYGWCSAAIQDQGVSWTNPNSGVTASGYSVVPVAAPAVVQVPTGTGLPTDTDSDGLYNDVNGNARKDFGDVVLYFNQMTWISANEPIAAFDCNGNGRIDFADVVWLFNHL